MELMEATTMFRFFSAVILNPKPHKLFSSLSIFPSATAPRHFQSLKFPTKHSENRDIGDRVVFEDGIFENDAVFQNDSNLTTNTPKRRPRPRTKVTRITPENLVPDKWREVQSETKITINERRKNMKKKKNRRGLVPLRDANKIEVEKKLSRYKDVNWDEYKSSKKAKLRQINPLVLTTPSTFPVKENLPEPHFNGERVEPKNPRGVLHGKGLEDVMQFFNSGNYNPSYNTTLEGRRKLFAITKEEVLLLNKRMPDLAVATSGKWLPLHTLAAGGELYLLDSLLKHNVDINAVDKDGLTAIHKAIGKKKVITNYLLKNSANPFVRDKEGATLMHYAVQTASIETIELLLLYNVDINLQDNDGWTPLHLAVQTQRPNLVRLLLLKGADKTLRNQLKCCDFRRHLHNARGEEICCPFTIFKISTDTNSSQIVDKFHGQGIRHALLETLMSNGSVNRPSMNLIGSFRSCSLPLQSSYNGFCQNINDRFCGL